VRDTGEGIPQENLDRIAEPNWTTRNPDRQCHSCEGGKENAARVSSNAKKLPAVDGVGPCDNSRREMHKETKKRKIEESSANMVEATKSRHVYGVAGEFLASLR
jgi:hypothetical protein